MAHLPALPALGDYVAPDFTLTEEIPNGECHRRKTFEKSSEVHPINAVDAAMAEIRYNSVRVVPVHPQLRAMLETLRDGQNRIQVRLQNFQNAQGQFQVELRDDLHAHGQAQQRGHLQVQEAINDFNTKLDTFIRVSTARSFNQSIKYNQRLVPFQVPPKILAGHPFVDHPNVPGVNLNHVYQVGADPPNGLVPLNFGELNDMRGDMANSLSRLRALFWFYNDPRLFIADNATESRCEEGWDNFKTYIRK
ncbi:Unknown protein [Striga hermonthica]|uniref:Uncharacterized protein n=1 Tax=Striga hermonthica TaxID=68872 RepID=A0A9N7N214_STRHE|nr:Unknown protein [Striga hermonthica]